MDWHFLHIPKTGGTAVQALEKFAYLGHGKAIDPKKTFAIVRNPYDRAVSLCCEMMEPEVMSVDVMRACWIDRGNEFHGAELANRTQTSFLTGGEKLLRFETLEDDVKEFLGIDLPYLNVCESRTADYSQYYDDELREVIYNKFEVDFVNFAYPRSISRVIKIHRPKLIAVK